MVLGPLFVTQHKWETLGGGPPILLRSGKCVDKRPTVCRRPSSWLCMDYVLEKWCFVGPWIRAEHRESQTCNNKECMRRSHHPGPEIDWGAVRGSSKRGKMNTLLYDTCSVQEWEKKIQVSGECVLQIISPAEVNKHTNTPLPAAH